MTYRPLCVLFFCATLINCATEFDSRTDIDLNELANIVKILASDEFEGRAPGGRGEEKTVAYLIERFQSLGLQPGGENGGWTQAVPLIHARVLTPVAVQLETPTGMQLLEQVRDIEMSTTRSVESIEIENADLVFVGFGATAPGRSKAGQDYHAGKPAREWIVPSSRSFLAGASRCPSVVNHGDLRWLGPSGGARK